MKQELRMASLYALPGIPLVQPGDDLARIIAECASNWSFQFEDNDIVVIAQKIVSKAENAIVDLATITPTPSALELAQQTGRDPRLCQVYLNESTEILAIKGRHVVTRHRLGLICAAAGVDSSNVAPRAAHLVVLLPCDPDTSARRIRSDLLTLTGKKVAVIISDSLGRDDRLGSIGMAIGVAGIRPLEERHQQDLFENASHPFIDIVDEIGSAASLLMGQSNEALPVVILRGIHYTIEEQVELRSGFAF